MQRIALLVALAVLASSCGGRSQSALDEAMSVWSDAAIDSYEFVYSFSCECDPSWSGPWRVTVTDGEVTSFTHDQGLEPAPEFEPRTIVDMFDTAQSAIREHRSSHAISYDPQFGFPLTIQADLEALEVDGGLSLSVREFTPK